MFLISRSRRIYRRTNVTDKGTFLTCIRTRRASFLPFAGSSPTFSIVPCTRQNLHSLRCVDGDAFPRIECARTSNVSRDGQLSHPRRAHLSSYFCRHFCFSMPLGVRARVCDGARRGNFTFRNVSTSISPRQYDTLRQPQDRTCLRRGNKIRRQYP